MTKSKNIQKKHEDFIGKKINHLTVTSEFEMREVGKTRKHNRKYIKCICDCGNETWLTLTYINNGHAKSCGCLKGNNWKYKDAKLYDRWQNMVYRCTKEDHKSYEYYKQRGICEEWKNSFDKFAEWSYANGYKEELTIDRIDNSKGYFPDNCRWVTWDIQNSNKDNRIRIEYEGELYSLKELSELTGIPYKTLSARYYKWDMEKFIKKLK